ncbi:hypothetical protein ACS0TY_030749 [Phlomoides rotata]
MDNKFGNDVELYSVDYLNSIKCPELPNHRLVLKMGVPIMLLRNINQKTCLCNGTRLVLTKLFFLNQSSLFTYHKNKR